MFPQETSSSFSANQSPKKTSSQIAETKKQLLTEDLGWSETETQETYYRLKRLQEDWDVPGMEVYDNL